MTSRRNIFRVVALAATVLLAAPAGAEPQFKSLVPLLVDLNGWTGGKPDGMSMDMGSAKMTTALRKYEKDDASVEASVVMGSPAQAALASISAGINVETMDGHIAKVELKGLPALKTFNTSDSSGTILVALGDQAMFSLNYHGIAEDEAVALAQSFDWKAMQGLTSAK
jgi:hypothetical protein